MNIVVVSERPNPLTVVYWETCGLSGLGGESNSASVTGGTADRCSDDQQLGSTQVSATEMYDQGKAPGIQVLLQVFFNTSIVESCNASSYCKLHVIVTDINCSACCTVRDFAIQTTTSHCHRGFACTKCSCGLGKY